MLKVDISNKRYMCSPAYWQDKYHSQMTILVDKLMFQRDLLGTIAKNNSKDFFQRTDGIVEQKPKSGFFKFLKGPSRYEKEFVESMNEEYSFIKSNIYKLSKDNNTETK